MLFKRMDLSSDCDSLKQVLEETFCSLEDIVKKGTKERESSLFYQIEDYIRQNCDQELKLSELAKRFSINYTYLSTLFYQNTREHFPDYLNRTRVERAKELLRTTDDSIQCISENCGFMNQGYFSKVFKKLCPVHPKNTVSYIIEKLKVPLLEKKRNLSFTSGQAPKIPADQCRFPAHPWSGQAVRSGRPFSSHPPQR